MAELFVYFVRESVDGPIKIGVGGDPTKRVSTLQVGNPRELILMGYIPGDHRLEYSLHHRFKQWRLCGEWFSADAPGLVELARAAGHFSTAVTAGLDEFAGRLLDGLTEAMAAEVAKRSTLGMAL